MPRTVIGDKFLIMRMAEQKSLSVSPIWSTETHAKNDMRLEMQIRVVCDEYYYGPQCSEFCRPKDDPSGHYVCTTNGSISCMQGWKGPNCDQGRVTVVMRLVIFLPN